MESSTRLFKVILLGEGKELPAGRESPGHLTNLALDGMITPRRLYDGVAGFISRFCQKELVGTLADPAPFSEYGEGKSSNLLNDPTRSDGGLTAGDTWIDMRENRCLGNLLYADENSTLELMREHYQGQMNRLRLWMELHSYKIEAAIHSRYGDLNLLPYAQQKEQFERVADLREQIASPDPVICGYQHEWRIGDQGIALVSQEYFNLARAQLCPDRAANPLCAHNTDLLTPAIFASPLDQLIELGVVNADLREEMSRLSDEIVVLDGFIRTLRCEEDREEQLPFKHRTSRQEAIRAKLLLLRRKILDNVDTYLGQHVS